MSFVEEKIVSEQLGICAKIKTILDDRYGDEKPGYYIQTLGCQQNEADSERMAGLATLMGYKAVDDPEDARLIFVNTCAIREHAEKRALSFGSLRFTLKLNSESERRVVYLPSVISLKYSEAFLLSAGIKPETRESYTLKSADSESFTAPKKFSSSLSLVKSFSSSDLNASFTSYMPASSVMDASPSVGT